MPQGFKSGFDLLRCGRERHADVTLTVRAEDDAGDGGNLRPFEQQLRRAATVGADGRDVWKSVKRAGRRLTGESEFVQAADE